MAARVVDVGVVAGEKVLRSTGISGDLLAVRTGNPALKPDRGGSGGGGGGGGNGA